MCLETHASPNASLASPLLFALHVPSRTLVGIIPSAACFNYKLFDYILTPRYKGSMCLLKKVQNIEPLPVLLVCIAYVYSEKLLNCSLLLPDQIVPDIYALNQDVGGSPVDIYIHLKHINIAQFTNNPKACMMDDYKEKNELFVEWDRQIAAGTASSDDWMSQFLLIRCN
jgi:hypothetical protein